MPNERIVFTEFLNQRIPALSRWREREEELMASPQELDSATALPRLADRGQAANSAQAARTASLMLRQTRKPPNFNETFTVWRLISANHRELARGAGTFPDYAQAAARAESVRDAAANLKIALVRRPRTGELAWHAALGGRPVLLAAAWHRSARDRDRSLTTALQALAGARILPTVARHGHRHLTDTSLADSLSGHQLP